MKIKKSKNGYKRDHEMDKEWILVCIGLGIAVGFFGVQLILSIC